MSVSQAGPKGECEPSRRWLSTDVHPAGLVDHTSHQWRKNGQPGGWHSTVTWPRLAHSQGRKHKVGVGWGACLSPFVLLPNTEGWAVYKEAGLVRWFSR